MAKYRSGYAVRRGKVQVSIFQNRQSTDQHISLAVHMRKQGPRRAFHLNCNHTIFNFILGLAPEKPSHPHN